MEISELFALLAGIGVIALYLKTKQNARDLREARVKEAIKEADEIHRAAQEIRDGLVKKKEEYEEAKRKLVVFAVHDGDKSSTNDDESK